MRMPEFLLEDHFARYKAACRFNLTSSDVEGVSIYELVEHMDDEVGQLWSGATLAYGPSGGHPLLRQEIAKQYKHAHAEDVMVFTGATEAIFAVLNVLLEPGDHAVVVGPIYQLLADLPGAAGAEVTRVDLRYEDDWILDPGRVQAAVTPKTRVIVVNFPNNPTGALPSREVFAELAEIADLAGAVLLSDELYRGLELSAHALQLPAGSDVGPAVISVSAVSKVYGLAGARIGWVVCRNPAMKEALKTFKYWSSLSNSVPSELLALAALRRRNELLRRGREFVAASMTRLEQLVTDHQDHLEWVRPRAGTTAYPRLRHGSSTDLAQWLAQQHSIFVAPSSVIPTPGEHLRIGLGRADIVDGLEQLDRALRSPDGQRLLS